MKKIPNILVTMILLITACSCSPKTLDEQTAREVIIKEYKFPRIIDHDIFCNDPAHAYTILKSGLVEKGFVKVLQSKKFGDTTSFVSFTPAAKPYLLPTTKDDKKYKIQRVKVGDEEFDKIKDISIMSSENKAIVTYSRIRRKSIFAAAMKNPISDTVTQKVYFIRTKDGWQITKNSEIEFLAF